MKNWKDCKRVYVTAYETDRAYGGPEEGGWWYDTYKPIECKQTTPDKAQALLDAMCNEWAYDRNVVVYIETLAHASKTRHRPYYC